MSRARRAGFRWFSAARARAVLVWADVQHGVRGWDATVATLSARRMFWLTAATNLTVLMGMGVLFLAPPQEARFSANLLTEYLSIQLPVGGAAPDGLADALPAGSDPKACVRKIELYQPIEAPLRLDFEVDAAGPSVLLRPVGARTGAIGLDRRCGQDPREIVDSVRVRPFPGTGGSSTLVLEGIATFGQPPGTNRSMLRSGQVTASTTSAPLRSARATTTADLMLGDELGFYPSKHDMRAANTNVIVRYDAQEKAFRVVAQTGAGVAKVTRLGQGRSFPITIAPNFWSRLQAQAEWAILLVVFALILNVLSAARQYAESARLNSMRDNK